MDSTTYSYEFIQDLLNNIADGVYFVDRKRKLTYWNKGAERITGYTKEEVLNAYCYNNILNHIDCEGNHLCTGQCPLQQTINEGKFHESEIYLHHKKGYRVPVTVRVNPIRDEQDEIIGAVEMFSDSTTQMAAVERIKSLEKEVYIDALTNLPNRAYLEQTLQTHYENFTHQQWRFGVIFMDIDHFKQFNDTYGHDVGDKILQLVSNTINHNARSFDTYGRWGGEEFLGIIPTINEVGLENLANRIRILISETTLEIEQKEINATISIGATLIRSGESVSDLLKRADQYLYESKRIGRNCVTCR